MKRLLSKIKSNINSGKSVNNKQEFINSITENSILEIGPFYNPICKGEHVKYMDILGQEQLKQRCLELSKENPWMLNHIQDIPLIDYVNSEGNLSCVTEKFDAIVSSHLIEHQLDLIGHFKDLEKILNDKGKYYLAIPDKRYCFDHYMNVSSLAEVIGGHYDKRTKHSLKSVLEHRAFVTHNQPDEHWNGNHGELLDTQNKIKLAIDEYLSNDYIDVHAWYFTPESFTEIIGNLYSMNFIKFQINKIYKTSKGKIEFFVELQFDPTEIKK